MGRHVRVYVVRIRHSNLNSNGLLVGVTIRVSEKEHGRLINKTEHVAIPGLEQDYVTGLDVFHQLHCLVSNT